MLTNCGSVDQLKACGFQTVKDQMKIKRLLEDAASVSILYGSTSDIKQSSQGGGSAKLTLHQMKEMRHVPAIRWKIKSKAHAGTFKKGCELKGHVS